MLLSAAIESITERVSIDFHHVEGGTYQARSANLNQWIHLNLMFKLLFWLPYKKPNIVISELFEFDNGVDSVDEHRGSNCVLNIVKKDTGAVGGVGGISGAGAGGNQDVFILNISGRLRHKFKKLLKNTKEVLSNENIQIEHDHTGFSNFYFSVEVISDPVDKETLVFTNHGEQQWYDQLEQFINSATRDICDGLSKQLKKRIAIQQVHINPLPRHPPWIIKVVDHPEKGKLVNIFNTDYRIIMKLILSVSMFR